MIHSFLSTRWAKKRASREVGIFFIDYNVLIKFRGIFFFFSKIIKKKVPVGPFYPTRAVDREELFI